MTGWLKYNTEQEGFSLIQRIDGFMSLPKGQTTTWQYEPLPFCSVNPQTSGQTDFWGYVIKVDTDQMGGCLSQQEIDSIIEIPNEITLCEL